MRIAIAQLNSTIGDIKGNAQKIVEVAQEAHSQKAQLLLTPELSLCGYPPKDLLLAPDFITMMAQELKAIARKIPPSLTALVGIATINEDAGIAGEKPLYNSVALLQGKKIKQIFHKQLLPTYKVFDESRYFATGKKTNYFVLNKVKIGVTICEDIWNDHYFWGIKKYKTNPVEKLFKKNIDLLINLSASPYCEMKQPERRSIVQSIIDNYQKPAIYVNQIGGNDELIFDGNSFAVNKKSNIIATGKNCETDLIYVDYCPEKKDIFSDENISFIDKKEIEIYSVLVLGVKDYARKCGFKKAIVGLSGGIDSALVAKIAVDALGKENVTGVLMPSPYSSDNSIIDSEKLAHNLGITIQTIPIEPMMKSFDSALKPSFVNTDFGITEENLQSRIRGTLLMAFANKFGYLLLSTGNKSEMSVGYCTLYGDMNGGLAVIGDVPKMMVFSLCKWLNKDQEIIPQNIINKPPSAELKPEQKDEDSLPPYPILDEILEQYIYLHKSEKQIVKLGFDLEVVRKVIRLVNNAEFKRKQAPPILRISSQAFGTDWRMPIAKQINF